MTGITKMSKGKRSAGLLGAALLLAAGSYLSSPAKSRSWLGPLAPVAAQVQWVRAEGAISAGRPGQALRLMESAVELDPGATTGWVSLADHMGLYLASAESGADMETRATWLRTALELAQRGEDWARQPQLLALHRGLLLVSHADLKEPMSWGGATGDQARIALFRDAAAAFEDAAAMGHEDGEHIAEYARNMIEGLGE